MQHYIQMHQETLGLCLLGREELQAAWQLFKTLAQVAHAQCATAPLRSSHRMHALLQVIQLLCPCGQHACSGLGPA